MTDQASSCPASRASQDLDRYGRPSNVVDSRNPAGKSIMNSSSEENTADPKLLEILVCPITKGPLEFDATRQELVSRSAKLAYPIRDGIPIMLPEEARKID
jgi:uncharacterized protein YbaR (Trm112 family)